MRYENSFWKNKIREQFGSIDAFQKEVKDKTIYEIKPIMQKMNPYVTNKGIYALLREMNIDFKRVGTANNKKKKG